MTIEIDPRRPKPKIRPFKAMGHMNKLLANKEDTEQVFHIIEALDGNTIERRLKSVTKTAGGQAMMERRRELPPILDDHARWEALPEGTVGRAYVAFMKREGLTAAGLVEESEKMFSKRERFEDDLEFYGCRLRDIHDLYHVLSGYGRDQLGEVCVLAFSNAHIGGMGSRFISFMGARDLSKFTPNLNLVKAAHKEAKASGRASLSLVCEDIVALMHEPLVDARARMNIPVPIAYRKALISLTAAGYEGQLSAA